MFPVQIRSTFNGLSSAGGKIGALIGSSSFDPLQDSLGFSYTYLVCMAAAILGVVVTVIFVPGNSSWALDQPLRQQCPCWSSKKEMTQQLDETKVDEPFLHT